MINCKNIKNDKGITILALSITVIVLLIISGVSITVGTKIIKKVQVESIMTNMISIKAKTKIYIEEANSKSWNLNDTEKANKKKEVLEDTYKMTSTTINEDIQNLLSSQIKENGFTCYSITKEALDNMNLNNIYGYDQIEGQDSGYVVAINDLDDSKNEIIYTKGVKYLNNIYYTLSEMQINI